VPRLLVIALGGVVGSLARFAVARLFGDWGPDLLPLATLTVNVVGCLAIGVIATVTATTSASAVPQPGWIRPFLITGVLGGFTTVSAFALETGVLLDSGRIAVAVTYVLVTMVAGLLAVRLGALLVRRPS
jgi:fluoride exporter